MSDFYTNANNVENRLLNEWIKYGKLVIAYDFDNTVYDYHNEGHTYTQVIELLRRCKALGAHLIVFTASEPERYDKIKSYLNENEVPYDAINENPDFVPFKTSKIYYNILLDDRAGLELAYKSLLAVTEKYEETLKQNNSRIQY